MTEKEVRLIDANELLSKRIPFENISYHKLFNNNYTCGFNDALSWVRSAIEETPTIAPENLCPQGKWISVEDRLPDKFGFYLVASRYGVVSCKLFNWIGDIPIFEYELVEDGYYTHWMPLPEPPISGAKMEREVY